MNQLPRLILKNYNGWETYVNKDVGYAPYFSAMLNRRVNRKQATNIVVTGEPGEGKSYHASDICRVLAGRTKSGKDRFKIKQVVFTFKEYMSLILSLPMGKPIVFDEPSYAMGKRDWYKELNKALVLTIESQRFKVHPLFIPIINKALLDKTLRSYLIQFQVEMRDRGRAVVYRIYPSQHTEKIYRYTMCELEFGLFDNYLCNKESCLDCNKLQSCEIFRAQYERKKASIQEQRYEQAYDDATKQESKELTNRQLANMLYHLRDKYRDSEGHLDVGLMIVIASEEIGVNIGHTRSYTVAKLLKYLHPNDFS
jgi:hypothetical protein